MDGYESGTGRGGTGEGLRVPNALHYVIGVDLRITSTVINFGFDGAAQTPLRFRSKVGIFRRLKILRPIVLALLLSSAAFVA